MTLRQILDQRLRAAMLAAGIPSHCEPHIALSKNSQFGDYQANGAMAAAKVMGTAPRALAEQIQSHLQLDDLADKTEIAGPGFINIYLKASWLAQNLASFDAQISPAQAQPQTIVVDYSGPNLAKEMHVGHLRSTIIGDAVVRTLEYLGHKVIRQNHVGDWGTQFGMLIGELAIQMRQGGEMALKDLEQFYQAAKKRFDEDAEFADTARDNVVKLQSGDPETLQLWQKFRDLSLQHSDEIYQQLQVSLNRQHIRGESAYNDALAPLVSRLQHLGLAVNDAGAQVVFLSELADKNGKPSPVIVQKQDGGYLYSTTDLAALEYRAQTLRAQRILYFIDARQSLHLQQVFILAKKAGLVAQEISLEHHAFGTMMGEDNKPFKTRTGGTVKLAELLTEATTRAAQVVQSKNPELTPDEMQNVASAVGIGAVKYADLSKTRTLDYVFSWDAMLSFEGNTGPYLQYAYTRIRSIFRRATVDASSIEGGIFIEAPQEKALALKILQWGDTLEQVAQEAMPHILCNYLYDLASLFMTFYEACPILKPEIAEQVKNSRLLLSQRVAQTLQTGLGLLGIEVLEKM